MEHWKLDMKVRWITKLEDVYLILVVKGSALYPDFRLRTRNSGILSAADSSRIDIGLFL